MFPSRKLGGVFVAVAACCILFAGLYVFNFNEPSFSAKLVQVRGGFISVNVSTGRLVDEDGRERIFRGTNVVYKSPPYYPNIDGDFNFQYSFNMQDIKLLNDWGQNIVRLGVMWPGVEPTRGTYDYTYLKKMDEIITRLGENGIYTVIDMHQDSFSKTFCGEGIPVWATQASYWARSSFPEPFGRPFKLDNSSGYPIPYEQDCAKWSWSESYATFELNSAAQNLYDNTNGLLDAWAGYWKVVAQTWESASSVLGYELINEPWAGDVWVNPLLLVPGVADKENLQPVYGKLNEAIRSVDDRHIVLFPGVTWDDITVGFTQPPGGADYRNRSVLAYHYYSPPNFKSPREQISVFTAEGRRLGCGAFLTETDSLSAVPPADEFLQSVMHWEYKEFVGKTGANFGFWFPNGSLNYDFVKNSTRSYAPAVAGHIISMSFDDLTGVFQLVYNARTECRLPTEIYLSHKAHYPNGFSVALTPSGMATWEQPDSNHIYIKPLPTTPSGTQITVLIQPYIK